jgi:Skp family chaperone for outer membrane proteins
MDKRSLKTMMKQVCAVLLAGLATGVVWSQTPTPPATPAPGAAAAQAGGGTGAEGKVAYVDTAQFRTGIDELRIRLDSLNSEFEPKKKEIQALEEEVNNLKNKIQTQGATVSPQVRNQWVEEATEKERMLKRRAEDYEALGQKRLGEISQPIYEKVGRFLEQYCQARGIVMVLEGGAAQQAGVLIFASPNTNVTEDFMKEYNKANPAK